MRETNLNGERLSSEETPAEFDTQPLALRPKDAAKALSIGERLLWSKTNAGEIPHVRIGKAIVYPVDSLRDWLTEKTKGGNRN